MKHIILSFFIFISLNADEMQRIEAIVEDIAKLRSSYEECQQELKSKNVEVVSVVKKEKCSCDKEIDKTMQINVLLKDEREKNTLLLSKIESLNNEIELYKKELKNKEKVKIVTKNTITVKECKPNKTVKKSENSNIFPKLIMKDEYRDKTILTSFKASAFRLKVESDIYDSVDGKVIATWDEKTSFTSSIGTQKWIKITGYFVDKKWRRAKETLWIQRSKVIIRNN